MIVTTPSATAGPRSPTPRPAPAPAARFSELARRFDAEVRVRCAGAGADGKSALDLICLAAGEGTMLELEAHGPDAEEAVTALADLISARFHEAEACLVA